MQRGLDQIGNWEVTGRTGIGGDTGFTWQACRLYFYFYFIHQSGYFKSDALAPCSESQNTEKLCYSKEPGTSAEFLIPECSRGTFTAFCCVLTLPAPKKSNFSVVAVAHP